MKVRPHPILERISLAGPASVLVREFREAAFRYPLHQHPEVELTWIVKGSGLRYVGDSVEPFHAGDFCVLGRNLPHAWLSPESEGGPVQSLVVQFDPARWGPALYELPELAKIANLFERAARGLRFDAARGERARRKMMQKASPLGYFASLLEVLEELADDEEAQPLAFAPWAQDRRMSSDPRVRSVLSYLANNSTEPIAQSEAARLVRLSPAAFSRFFRRAMGKTFKSYLTDLRLSDACRRLLETDDTISESAFAAGFENLSTFNRAFRKARGMSPREFREEAFKMPRRTGEVELRT